MFKINGIVYKSYEEQVLENKEDIEGLDTRTNKIEQEISDLKIETVKCVTTSGTFETDGTILMVVVHTDTETIPVYIDEDSVIVDGIVDESGSSDVTCTITSTTVETSGCSATIYFQD